MNSRLWLALLHAIDFTVQFDAVEKWVVWKSLSDRDVDNRLNERCAHSHPPLRNSEDLAWLSVRLPDVACKVTNRTHSDIALLQVPFWS
jgi:hypothetical protein